MGTLSQKKFVDLLRDAPVHRVGSHDYYSSLRGQIGEAINNQNPPWADKNDEASLVQAYEAVRDYIVQNGYLRNKLLRPWLIDKDYTAHLDRSQTWWGFEFETGWASQKARATANRFVWDNFDGVAFDSEGEGNYTVEITFGPEERSKFHDGTAQAYRFYEFLDQNQELVYNSGEDMIGTHINLSHPLLNQKNHARMVNALTRTVGSLPVEMVGHGNCRYRLFGRTRLYGGFFAQDQGGKQWIEGKLFRTTYNLKGFQNYINTAEALSKCVDAIFAAMEDGSELAEAQRLVGALPYVDNLWEVALEGADPHVMWAKGDGREGGDVNNGYHRNVYKNKHPQDLEAIRAEAEKKRKEEEERKRKEEEERKRAEAEARLAAIHTKIHKSGKKPKDLPKGYEYCEHCEVYHNDDDEIWMGEE